MKSKDASNILLSKIFKDKSGKIVLFEFPNYPLALWIVCNILIFFFTKGNILKFLELISFGSLFTWAWLEIFQGVNYYRRLLGIIVMIVIIKNRMG